MDARTRVAPVEGLRAIAALGVVWIHCWSFTGVPALPLGINWARLLAILGQGVDLFFVISGFCMHLAYGRKHDALSVPSYLSFLGRRWLRIAPAFYAVALACFLGRALLTRELWWYALATHLTFTNLILRAPTLAGPFWSLDIEWQFYVLLPALVWAMERLGTRRALAVAVLLGIAFRAAYFYGLVAHSGLVPMHLASFAWGTAVGAAFVRQAALPRWLERGPGALLALAIASAGRLLRTHEVEQVPGWGPLSFALSDPLMTAGFAALLWNASSSASAFSRFLETRPMRALGTWSYSIYLTHWWIAQAVAAALLTRLGKTFGTAVLAFAVTSAIVIPLSRLLYQRLELPYFRWVATGETP